MPSTARLGKDALTALLLGLAAACGTAEPAPTLTVAAAASLNPALQQVAADFTRETGIDVELTFGATGHLAQQIRNGAPFDVFASADASRVDRLIAEGLLAPETRMVFAHGRLILAVDPQRAGSITSVQDLADQALSPIVLANPAHAPYGLAAQQALTRAGLWDPLLPRLIFAETVRQAAQVLETGNAPVAFLAASVFPGPPFASLELPPDSYDPILHVAAARSGSPERDRATRFLRYLSSEPSRRTLAAFGLRVPQEP